MRLINNEMTSSRYRVNNIRKVALMHCKTSINSVETTVNVENEICENVKLSALKIEFNFAY